MTDETPTASLKSRIADGCRLRGLLVRVPSTMLIDIAGYHGYDFILLDTEHGIADQRDLIEHVVAARAARVPLLVRIGEDERSLALRALDAGAEGVVVPHVSSASAAEAAVGLAHYPPRGSRGFATYTPAGCWGRTPADAHADQAARRTVVIAMIEDGAGVESAAAIAATEGVDAIWVGPSDLRAALGYDSVAADSARRRVWRAAEQTGTPVLAIASGAEDTQRAFSEGAQLVVLNAQAAIEHVIRSWVGGV